MKSLFLILAASIAAWVITRGTGSTLAGWIVLACLSTFLAGCGLAFLEGAGFKKSAVTVSILSFVAGFSAAALGQIETHFSDEEFLAAFQGLVLSGYWAVFFTLLWLARRVLPIFRSQIFPRQRYALGLILFFGSLAGGLATLFSYQNSFYPQTAPGFSGISAENPFLCGSVAADDTIYDGQAVFDQILGMVEDNPEKETPEIGFLALGTREKAWEMEFRDRLLEEMRSGAFTRPTNSVKYAQFEAALRAYYYNRLAEQAPGLFSGAEKQTIHAWFAEINRRAWTLEWPDWLYTLAFWQSPTGLFQNQDIGAGLLAMLESAGLSDPALSSKNRAYLLARPRGWEASFRNSDDAIDYQQEWIYNAMFQSWFTGRVELDNLRNAFEWLWLQALPDGSALQVNHPVPLVQTGIAYLGASLLQDDRLLWISGRSSEYFQSISGKQTAVPGLERAYPGSGRSPQTGSCLIYANSGIPGRLGQLAPDKLVFRDGWSKDSAYLLLNLRFTGWHRYKASGSVTRLYQAGEIVGEQLQGETAGWLPAGRSQFRDKRIPRQNLNALQIERSGLSAVLYALTRLGSPWAQDPPYYAQVESFETGPDLDAAHLSLEYWHGWTHSRRVYFYHHGPIFILDQAKGPRNQAAAITWHLPEATQAQTGRIAIPTQTRPAELLTFLLDPEQKMSIEITPSPETGQMQVQYLSPQAGSLSVLSVFLTGEWAGAQGTLRPVPRGWEITLTKGGLRLVVELPAMQ